MVIVSAPGKIHLIGEHAVVYGEPAILAAISKRVKVELEKHDKVRFVDRRLGCETDKEWTLDEIFEAVACAKELWEFGSQKKDFSPLFNFMRSEGYTGYKKASVGIVLERLGIKDGVSLIASGDLPSCAGVGSSSALAVCLTAGIAALNGKHLTREEINANAFELEKMVHGTPSGGDNTACCFGGLIWFQKANPRNVAMSLSGEIAKMPQGFVLVNTEEHKASTGDLVQCVRNLDSAYREPRIKEIGNLAYEMKSVLANKNYGRMKDIINRNQQLLGELGVSTPAIDKIVEAVRGIGGAAKLCGAGGGGMVLCWSEDVERLKATIYDLGYEPSETELGAEGVKFE